MNKFEPLVTIYVTTKNRKALLQRCIESIEAQTYSNIELIVSDDGSQDGTQEFLREKDAQGALVAVLNKESSGACVARNFALKIAKGQFITGMDDDDYMLPHRIESFVQYWSTKVLGSDEAVCALYDDTVMLDKTEEYTLSRKASATHRSLRRENIVGNQVFTPTEFLKSIDGFDPQMPALQDWDTWLRLSAKHGVLYNINEASYVQDVGHDAGRITQKKSAQISLAFSLLKAKLKPLSWQEQGALAEVKNDYPQVQLTLSEITMLLLSLRVRKGLSAIKRKFG